MSSEIVFDDSYSPSKDRIDRLKYYIKEYRAIVAKLINDANNQNNQKFLEADVDDVLQETIIVYYEKLNDATFQLTVKESTFIYAIAKNKISERIRKTNKINIISSDKNIDEIPEEIYDLNMDNKMEMGSIYLKNCMNLLSETKRKVLELYYYHNYSLKEIAQMTGLVSENAATVQKFRAFKELEVCVKSKK